MKFSIHGHVRDAFIDHAAIRSANGATPYKPGVSTPGLNHRRQRAVSPFHLADLQTSSSTWAKVQDQELANFAWQRGYGCFPIIPSHQDSFMVYIGDQENHHRTRTYQDEFRRFLRNYKVAYDETYVWDCRVGAGLQPLSFLRPHLGLKPQADMESRRWRCE
jgi:hypothetical protein